jgi:hypothetical protein
MNPNEVFEYVNEGIKWLALGGGTYLTTLYVLNGIPRLFSEKIHNQEDLDRITTEEAEKLGMTRSVIPKFHEDSIALSTLLDNDTYEIHLGGFGARRTQVRHELYHIHRKHHEQPWTNSKGLKRSLNYLLKQEPQAIAYEVFRLKL